MHATAGAFTGIILDERGDTMASAAAGALGAFVAETFTYMCKPKKPTFQSIKAKEEELGRSLSEIVFKELYHAEMKIYDTSFIRFIAFCLPTSILIFTDSVVVAFQSSTVFNPPSRITPNKASSATS